MKIKIIPLSQNLIIPTRAHYNDAGLDCYALEDYNLLPMGNKGYNINMQEIPSNNALVIPLGFGLDIPDGYVATIRPRSSLNVQGVITQIGTIDSGYHGEIKCVLLNCSTMPYTVKKGQRICQIIVEPVTIVDLVIDKGEERGEGGFGSTGK